MADLNQISLLGNVGADPEVRTTPSGTRVAKFSLATNRKFKDRSGQVQEKTDWHRVTVWDKLAEVVERYLHKGDRVFVQGRMEYSQTQADDGTTRYWSDVQVGGYNSRLILLGRPGASDAPAPGGQGQQQQGPPPPSPFGEDDDLPF